MTYSIADTVRINDVARDYYASGDARGRIVFLPLDNGYVELITIAPLGQGGGWIHQTVKPVDNFVGRYAKAESAATDQRLHMGVGHAEYQRLHRLLGGEEHDGRAY